MKERLQKFLAHAGVGSRRKNEELIVQGKVSVNGRVVTELGTKVDPSIDHIKVNNKLLKGPEEKVYYILHKPRGYLSTVKDERNRKTVMDLLQGVTKRVYPVGRLDYDSEGLVLLTNDGRLANRLMHPSYKIRKFYIVKIEGQISDESVESLRRGVELEDGVTAPAYVEVVELGKDDCLLKMGISEGRNRQIRRMCMAVGHKVTRLIRTQIGPIKLGSLPMGQYRLLTPQELGKLKQAVARR